MIKAKQILFILLISLGGFFLNSCDESEGQQLNKDEVEEKSRAASVEVIELSEVEFTDYIQAIGTMKPFEKADLGYTAGGEIKEIIYDKGSFVNKGDTILVMENSQLKANLDGAKSQYELAEMTFQKQSEIYEDNINSEFEFLQTKFNRDNAKANYDLIKARYDETFIVAPFSGLVDSKNYEEGEIVPPGLPIVKLMNIDKIKVEAGIPEAYAGKIKVGDKAKVSVGYLDTGSIDGKVIFIGSSVNTSNRTFPIEILINNKNKELLPELVADIKIENGKYKHVITIPDEVVNRTEKGYSVFIVNNNIAESRSITVLNRFQDKVAVKDGLNDGEQLVIVGYQNLVHGQNVTIVN
ncbi:MAG: efflux RND transporter periplasmic adaptor subunit [Melioribacteraceae bacterium]|nr:efflux RND transporter periplasmic adaptor subunit [Melioribacteraceae bacterium]MCF8353949.1 efflux RND transporter periplasmic adaptor subunit [Melioribacteraceae bacterium]MCF8393677.1 efflux RND transporter periplasmic adaptor subunit [Melioribacteraceae bacterium]MCF8419581.1 efflux RND transporter periplasmic adaptor subunit [Melioribacteraceae bacterium]